MRWLSLLSPLSIPIIALSCDESDPQPDEDPCAGSIVIHAQADVDAIASCTRIAGDVVVASESVSILDLSLLESVDGSLFMFDRDPQCDPSVDEIYCGPSTAMDAVRLPALASVGGDLDVRLAGVSALELPSLVSAGSLFLRVNGPPSTFDLSALETVEGGVRLETYSPASAELPSLRSVGGAFFIDSTTGVSAVGMPMLETVGERLTIARNEDLEAITMPLLREIGGALVIDENNSLPEIDLPALQSIGSAEAAAGFLNIQGNLVLTTLRLPALTSLAGNLYVNDNASLPSCVVDEIADQLSANGFDGVVSNLGNDELASCPP